MNKITFGFEHLELWIKVRALKIRICNLAKTFPPDEKYRLTDQLIRSIRSVNALVAEGHGRFTYPDQIHFCVQASGSLTEMVNHLIDAFDENYIPETLLHQLKGEAKHIEILLNGYISFLRRKRDEEILRKG